MMKLLALALVVVACSRPPDLGQIENNATYSSVAFGGGTSGTGDRSVSMTPAASTLIVAFASLSGNTQTSATLSDSLGGTYTQIGQAYWNSGANNMFAYVRDSLTASASPMTLTLDTNTNTAGEIEAVAFSGMSRAGTSAIKQIVVHGNLAANTLASLTFPNNVTSTDATIVSVASGDYTGVGTLEPSGWTERADAHQTSPITSLEIATKNSGFSGTTITYGGTQDTSFAEVGIELDNSSLPPPVDAGVDSSQVVDAALDASSDAAIDAPSADASTIDAAPVSFAHGYVEQVDGTGSNPAQITRDTQTSGSTFIVVSAGNTSDVNRGPTDNKSNTYTKIDGVDYADWSGSGAYVWAKKNATGGTSTTWSQYVTSGSENITFAIEVPSAGTSPAIIESETQHDNSGAYSPWLSGTISLTSATVTTTGPATLIAFWFGAGPTSWGNHVITSVVDNNSNPLTVLDGYGIDNPNGLVQGYMAREIVTSAGTYSVTWTYKPVQGAILYLIAVQP